MKKIKLTDYIQKTGEQISLSTAEREKLLSVMKEYMALKPVRGVAQVRRRPVWALYIFARKPLAIALVALLVVSSGAGISYAAEGALPGDVLYGVKVSVNEEVRALAAITQEDRAKWEAERAEKRLGEAYALAAEGRLTSKAEADLMTRFARHADKAVAHVEMLEKSDSAVAIDVASGFETNVAAHLEILDEVGEGAREEIRSLALLKARKVSNIRALAENGIAVSAPAPSAADAAVTMSLKAEESSSFRALDTEDSDHSDEARKKIAERMGKSAKKTLIDTEKLLQKTKAKFSFEEGTRLRTAIDEAKNNIDAGDAAMAEGEYGVAFHAYQKASVSLKKFNVFLRASLKGDIKFRIESLPPPEIMTPYMTVPPTDPAFKEGERETEIEIKPEFAEDAPLPAIQILPYREEVQMHTEDDGSVRIETETHTESSNLDTDGFIRIRVDKD